MSLRDRFTQFLEMKAIEHGQTPADLLHYNVQMGTLRDFFVFCDQMDKLPIDDGFRIESEELAKHKARIAAIPNARPIFMGVDSSRAQCANCFFAPTVQCDDGLLRCQPCENMRQKNSRLVCCFCRAVISKVDPEMKTNGFGGFWCNDVCFNKSMFEMARDYFALNKYVRHEARWLQMNGLNVIAPPPDDTLLPLTTAFMTLYDTHEIQLLDKRGGSFLARPKRFPHYLQSLGRSLEKPRTFPEILEDDIMVIKHKIQRANADLVGIVALCGDAGDDTTGANRRLAKQALHALKELRGRLDSIEQRQPQPIKRLEPIEWNEAEKMYDALCAAVRGMDAKTASPEQITKVLQECLELLTNKHPELETAQPKRVGISEAEKDIALGVASRLGEIAQAMAETGTELNAIQPFLDSGVLLLASTLIEKALE